MRPLGRLVGAGHTGRPGRPTSSTRSSRASTPGHGVGGAGDQAEGGLDGVGSGGGAADHRGGSGQGQSHGGARSPDGPGAHASRTRSDVGQQPAGTGCGVGDSAAAAAGAGCSARNAAPEDEVDRSRPCAGRARRRRCPTWAARCGRRRRPARAAADLGGAGDLPLQRVVVDLADAEAALAQLGGHRAGQAAALGRVVDVDGDRRRRDHGRRRAGFRAGTPGSGRRRRRSSSRCDSHQPAPASAAVSRTASSRTPQRDRRRDRRTGRRPPTPGGVNMLIGASRQSGSSRTRACRTGRWASAARRARCRPSSRYMSPRHSTTWANRSPK